MTLPQILVFCLLGLAVGLWGGARRRSWLLLASSVLAIFWLQPGMPLRFMDFWFPAATLALTVLVWAGTRPAGAGGWQRSDAAAALLIAALVLLIGLTRLFEPLCCLTATRPPPLLQIGLALLVTAAAAAALIPAGRRLLWLPNLLVVLLLAIFLLLKTQPFAEQFSAALRQLLEQDPALASSFDIRWLGFSYVSFRLIHVLRDRVAGRLPQAGLGEMVTFIIFFPAFTAGPIDRLQRFLPDLQAEFRLRSPELLLAGERIVWGIFKKFALADSLALIALDARSAGQIDQAGWMWVVLYAYSLQIYLDFSGYTDIAIGLGMLMGVRLPENFDRPYLKQNLTQFWNSWHITLAMWFRAYYFNPLTRTLRSQRTIPVQAIIFAAQVSTMVLIGLWHGVTWNFLIWGAWHGLGLFVHNRWSDTLRKRAAAENLPPGRARLLNWGGVLLTFNFVALGWVWFSLPAPEQALRVLAVLFGGGA